MSPIGGTPVPGSFPLNSTAALPNVTMAFPGERWSDRKAASAAIVPGTAVVPMASAGKLLMREVAGADSVTQMAIAMRPVDVPDTNPGSIYQEALGPNEIRNLPIKPGDYILACYSGAFVLTLIEAQAYVPGDLIGWKPGATPQDGKAGNGAWTKMGAGVVGPLFEVQTFRPVGTSTKGILNVRSLRGQA